MGQTPDLGLPYPEYDNDTDVPKDIKALADAVEAQLSAIQAKLALLTPTPWAHVTYENGWHAYSVAGWGSVQYMRDKVGIVRFKGLMCPTSPADLSTGAKRAFTLPPGFRPSAATPNNNENIFQASGYTGISGSPNGTTVRVDVSSTGGVSIEAIGPMNAGTSQSFGTKPWVSLNSVSFLAES